MKTTTKAAPTLTGEERAAKTMAHIAAIEALWTPLGSLEAKQRQNHPGARLLAMLKPVSLLFGVLARKAPEGALTEAQKADEATRKKLRDSFDVLGAADGGKDDDRFEVELLQARVAKVKDVQEIGAALASLARRFSDEALIEAGAAFGPSKLALDHARTLVQASERYRAMLSGVTDALRDMTAAAQAANNAAPAEPDEPANK